MSTGDHGEPPYELTRNPMDETYGFVCRVHALLRTGLTHQHAINVEAKHVREQHPDPLDLELDLREAARSALHYWGEFGVQSLWMTLTGLLDYDQARALAERLAEAPMPVRAAVVPL